MSPMLGTMEPEPVERARAIILFESVWTRQSGNKEARIRSQFGISAARYYQILSAALDDPGQLERDPVTVHRLRRVRDERLAARSGRRF